jgi:hypothetical protein
MGHPGDRQLERVTRARVTPAPLGELADLAALLSGDSERSKRFLGGLVAGALVGAAIAGAALLRRRTGDDRRA